VLRKSDLLLQIVSRLLVDTLSVFSGSALMGDYLQLSPPELRFRFELRKNIPVTLSLTNNGDERIAFKVVLQQSFVACATLSLSKFELLICMDRVICME
jgi:hypothetical protein